MYLLFLLLYHNLLCFLLFIFNFICVWLSSLKHMLRGLSSFSFDFLLQFLFLTLLSAIHSSFVIHFKLTYILFLFFFVAVFLFIICKIKISQELAEIYESSLAGVTTKYSEFELVSIDIILRCFIWILLFDLLWILRQKDVSVLQVLPKQLKNAPRNYFFGFI